MDVCGSADKESTAKWETWVQSLGWEDPRTEKLPTPVFWLGEFHALYSPWCCKELGTTERLSLHFSTINTLARSARNQSDPVVMYE